MEDIEADQENFNRFIDLLKAWTASVDEDKDCSETYNQLLMFIAEFDSVSRKSLAMLKSLEKDVIRDRFRYVETGRRIAELRNRLSHLTLRYVKAKAFRGRQVQMGLVAGIFVVTASPYSLRQKIEALTQSIRDLERKQRMLMVKIAHIEKQAIMMQKLTTESSKILQDIPLD